MNNQEKINQLITEYTQLIKQLNDGIFSKPCEKEICSDFECWLWDL